MSKSNPLTPHLELMVEKEASDLFLTANAPIKIKIDGKINFLFIFYLFLY